MTDGGFGRNEIPSSRASIGPLKAMRALSGTIGAPTMRLPTGGPLCSMPAAFRATQTVAGGRPRPIRISRKDNLRRIDKRVNKKAALMLVFAVVLLTGAGFRFARFFQESGSSDGLAYFYDVSERKLFVASRTLVPPIRGLNNGELDGMRAIVVSASGNPKDKPSRKIAYLEKYAPELKQQLESMQSGQEPATPPAGRISRGAAQSFTFVRRLNEENWYPVNSAEAEKIMTEWQAPRADGAVPVVCAP
jgi:hypothetical protein